jgi:hypothetical protein
MGRLRDIYLKYSVDIRDENGFLKNPLDLLEEIYMRISEVEYKEIRDEIFFQEKVYFVFDEEREAGNL